MSQVPLPFVVGKNTTVEVTGSEAVQIKGPGEALEKWQATLQVCFRGVGEQPKLAIIFRGQGNITDQERRQLDVVDEIDYYFQKKAWADPDFTKRWMRHTMKEAIDRCVGDSKPVLLFADNLAKMCASLQLLLEGGAGARGSISQAGRRGGISISVSSNGALRARCCCTCNR
jgi:hypothetical protein